MAMASSEKTAIRYVLSV